MSSYSIKSIIGEIAKGIEKLIAEGTITPDRKVILYGLDRYSFAMRTILANLGYDNIEGYISDEEALVMQYQSEIKNFACRFLNHGTDAIKVWTLKERLQLFDDQALVLLTVKEYEKEKAKLEELGYQEKLHFLNIYDFKDEKLDALLEGRQVMSPEEIKRTEKEILAYVDKFLREKKLRYWVCGGTLLGTIRHKGFIPWDDDIDIFLPWEDYLMFIESFRETERFGMMGFGTSLVNDFPDPFAKVVDKRTVVVEDIGTLLKTNPLFIDFFPLVGLPDDALERQAFFAGYRELNRQIWQEFYATNGRTDLFPKWFERQKAYLQKYEFDKAQYVGVLGTAYGERDCTRKSVYDRTLRMPFEDIEVNVSSGYKEYLDNLYGSNWMKWPEESDRKTHHNVSFYWNEKK